MGLESFKIENPANDNLSAEEINQKEGEEQRALYSVLERTLSSNAWTVLGSLSLAESFEKFENAVGVLNTLDRNDVSATSGSEDPQMVGVLNFTRGWKLRVSRSMDGVYTYEALP